MFDLQKSSNLHKKMKNSKHIYFAFIEFTFSGKKDQTLDKLKMSAICPVLDLDWQGKNLV